MKTVILGAALMTLGVAGALSHVNGETDLSDIEMVRGGAVNRICLDLDRNCDDIFQPQHDCTTATVCGAGTPCPSSDECTNSSCSENPVITFKYCYNATENTCTDIGDESCGTVEIGECEYTRVPQPMTCPGTSQQLISCQKNGCNNGHEEDCTIDLCM